MPDVEALRELVLSESESGPTTKIKSELNKPKVGDWFWVQDEKKKRLGCAVHIGSNFVKIQGVGYSEWRIHFKDFFSECTYEPNPEVYIGKKTAHYKREIDRLTNEIKELTTTLGLSTAALPEGQSAVSNLAVRNNDNAVEEYKTALVLAKEKTLPELFKQVEDAADSLATWLGASIIPLKAQADGFKPMIESIQSRIFNVELYAGLVETIELIADGKPASIGEPVHLFQRRAYMDEECLAQYECGGMEFDGIPAFDAWLARPENRDRLLPFPRCLIAFQVRRVSKEREGINLRDFISIITKEQEDKSTFLYMRNGEKMFRLQTAIEFGARLFPDQDAAQVGSEKVYTRMFCDKVDQIISAGAYDQMVKEEDDKIADIEEKKKKIPEKDHFREFGFGVHRESDRYEEFTPESVHYDDIEKYIQKQVEEHNRLVIVLQGIMDRSPVFHPHPKFSLWKEEDFSSAFKLVYDDSRALTPGDRPDFEAFRKSLNESLCDGCVTVGQDDFWELLEGERESEKRENNWRTRSSDYRPKRFRPYGNPGPGWLATVEKYQKRAGKCTYKWERQRQTYDRYGEKSATIPCSLAVPQSSLLNVNAYKPGSFKQFFNDPRTRADYLVWAPYLLAAEEWHAGNKDGKVKHKRNR